jgi:hypothetical protein
MGLPLPVFAHLTHSAAVSQEAAASQEQIQARNAAPPADG